jgi:CMP-N,N'-diacetyllegionaminic acid synthase
VEVPFLRPKELATDEALAPDVVLHTLDWLRQNEKYQPELILWLQPTSPLRTAGDIESAAQLLFEKEADAVVSVCPADHHPRWMKELDKDGIMTSWAKEGEIPQRRQELLPAYQLNGAIYLVRRQIMLEKRTFNPPATFAYVMPQERSLDVDTPWDIYLADLILRERSKPC